MEECINLKTCPFFNDTSIKQQSRVVERLKKYYCRDQYNDCARYKIFKEIGKEHVPLHLFPNENDEAERIIRNRKGS